MSKKQSFVDNLLIPVPITPNQQGTFEMMEKFLSNSGSQEMDTCNYELSGCNVIRISRKTFDWRGMLCEDQKQVLPFQHQLSMTCRLDDQHEN